MRWTRLCLAALGMGAVAVPFDVDERACTEGFQNPGFETGTLKSWTCFEPNDNGQTSCTIAKPGRASKYCVQMRSVDPGNQDNIGYLQQGFTVCKSVQYVLTYSLYLPQGKTTFNTTNNAVAAKLHVFLVTPSGGSYEVDTFNLRGTSYSRSYPFWTLPANQWNNFTSTFPFVVSGPWTLQFQLEAFDQSNKVPTIDVIRIDNVGYRPQ